MRPTEVILLIQNATAEGFTDVEFDMVFTTESMLDGHEPKRMALSSGSRGHDTLDKFTAFGFKDGHGDKNGKLVLRIFRREFDRELFITITPGRTPSGEAVIVAYWRNNAQDKIDPPPTANTLADLYEWSVAQAAAFIMREAW